MRRPALTALALQLLAGWPAWRWWLARVHDGSDEPWGAVALLALLVLGVRDARHPLRPAHLWGLAVANLALALAHPHLPPLVRAAVVVLCLTSLLSRVSTGRAFHAPSWGLALLVLPVLASVQFYLGYPLRVASAALAAPLLRLQGVPAVRAGVELQLGAAVVQVDAPCSGARMLWVALFLAGVLAHALRLGTARTFLLGTLAVGAVVGGNALRVSALALVETGRLSGPAWLHPAVGVAAFLPVVLALLAAARWQQAAQATAPGPEVPA